MFRDFRDAAGGWINLIGGGLFCAAFLGAIIFGGLLAEAVLTVSPQ